MNEFELADEERANKYRGIAPCAIRITDGLRAWDEAREARAKVCPEQSVKIDLKKSLGLEKRLPDMSRYVEARKIPRQVQLQKPDGVSREEKYRYGGRSHRELQNRADYQRDGGSAGLFEGHMSQATKGQPKYSQTASVEIQNLAARREQTRASKPRSKTWRPSPSSISNPGQYTRIAVPHESRSFVDFRRGGKEQKSDGSPARARVTPAPPFRQLLLTIRARKSLKRMNTGYISASRVMCTRPQKYFCASKNRPAFILNKRMTRTKI
ncbi:hypothetical protein B0H16DRAFT_1468525 [Mycena metata]|uniref:Uncharacterized protein n=1 Tax=Mycena metata TaxID=1033252 RepID=A0AAD7MUI0_9AGAR|nr:hypothetical protein B0H16DRAFT_1468525 [Mycena metata]